MVAGRTRALVHVDVSSKWREAEGLMPIRARDIGLAFQVQDDILDVTASTEELGKTAGKDLLSEKTSKIRKMGAEMEVLKLCGRPGPKIGGEYGEEVGPALADSDEG